MSQISTYEPESIYFGALSNVEKISMIRFWLLNYAIKMDSPMHLEENQETSDIRDIIDDKKSCLELILGRHITRDSDSSPPAM